MIVNTVTEAKANLSALLEKVLQGEEVIISRAGKPIGIIQPYRPESRPRTPGKLRGRITIADDFDALPPDLEKALGVTGS